jgi:hypothetical protein
MSHEIHFGAISEPLFPVTFFQLESARSSLVVLFPSLVKGLSALSYDTSAGVTLVFRGNSASKKFRGLEVLTLRDSRHCSTLRVLGKVIAKILPYP